MVNKEVNELLISVIIPVYNTSKYIKDCLDSVYAAISTDCEVIIVNDGSTDESEKIIKNYINNLKNIDYKKNTTYIYKKNKGLSDTKNVGIEKAKGKYISVVDSDDKINKNFYNDAREYLNNYDVIIYDIYTDYEDDKKLNHVIRAAREDIDGNLCSKLIHGAMQGSSCNKIIKKSLYKYKFPVGKEYEDVAVTPFILMNAKNIKYIPNPYYIYLQRKTSIVGKHKLYNAYFKICENLNDVFEKNKLKYNDYKEIIDEFYFNRIIENLDLLVSEKKGKINKDIEKYINQNKYIINEIKQNVKSVDDLPDLITKNQKNFELKLFSLMSESSIKGCKRLIRRRKILIYFRNILISIKRLISVIFGGIYHG